MSPETLLYAPKALLYQVQNGFQQLVADGPLTISFQPNGSDQRVLAEVGRFTWYLAPDVPTLKAEKFVYTFALADKPNMYLCLVLPEDTPELVLAAVDQVLEACSAFHTVSPHGPTSAPQATAPAAAGPAAPAPAGPSAAAVATQQQPPKEIVAGVTSEDVANAITKGGQLLGKGIKLAAAYTAIGIQKGAELAIRHTRPADTPYQVNPQLQARLATIRKWSGRTAKVATAAAEVTATIVGKLARYIAASLPIKSSGNGNNALKDIGSAGVTAFSEVLDAMEDAARLVLRTSGTAATAYMAHKYGQDAASASREVSQTAQHMYDAAMAAKGLKAKAIVKATAKETVRHVVVSGGQQNGGTAAAGAAAGATCVVTELEEDIEDDGPWMAVASGSRTVAVVQGGVAGGSGLGRGDIEGGQQQQQQQGGSQGHALAAGRYYPAVPAPGGAAPK